MYNIKTRNYAFLLLLFTALQGIAGNNGNEVSTGWEFARRENDISIYYRWVTSEKMKAREMRAKFMIRTGVDNILPQFYEPENYHAWAVGIKECTIHEKSDSGWVTYSLMNYPWPFKQKDLVTRHRVCKRDTQTVLLILAEPKLFAMKSGVERMQNYKGEWIFTNLENGYTEVDYRVISFTEPVFPRFMQDPVIQKVCIDSFHQLKERAEAR